MDLTSKTPEQLELIISRHRDADKMSAALCKGSNGRAFDPDCKGVRPETGNRSPDSIRENRRAN